MKDIPNLEALLARAVKKGIFGTKMFKFSIPTLANQYADLQKNEHIVRVVALSGGYS